MKVIYLVKNIKEISYCGDIVRKYDKDRFLVSLFAPADVLEDLWALFAFNHEIAKTREVVSETTLGLIRLQWWRDAVTAIYEQGNVADHEVLKPLAKAIKQHNLPQEHFYKLIYAREFDLEDVLPANIEGLMNYAEFTTDPLLRLAVQICGDDPEQEIIQPIAINYTIAGILRATGFFAGQGRCFFPENLMNEYGITREQLVQQGGEEKLKLIVKKIVDHKLPKAYPQNIVLKAFSVLSEIYFRQIHILGYDVIAPEIQREPNFKVLRLWWRTKIL